VGFSGTLENQGLQNMDIFCNFAVWGVPLVCQTFLTKKWDTFLLGVGLGRNLTKKVGHPTLLKLLIF
jgi:hypothetical protein